MKPAALAVIFLLAGPAHAVDTPTPPKPGPPRPIQLPLVQRHALSNGLSVLIVDQHEVPTVQLLLVIGTGAASDPADRPGLAVMTASMLDEGAGDRDALDLADAVDYLGADLGGRASWDYSAVSLHVPVRHLAEALPLMADVALRPRFPESELLRRRKEALTDLLQLRDDPQRLAAVALAKAIFSDHRYGQMASGDARSIGAMTVEELRRFHAENYRPGNATLIVVGDVTPSLLASLEQTFGPWPRGGSRPAPLPAVPIAHARTLWLVDRPEAPQSTLRVGHAGPDRRVSAYHAIEVASTLLGGLFTSRLNDNLRETHGYAYGAASGFAFRRVAGSFSAQADVQTSATAPALGEMVKEIERIRTPASPAEVDRARSYLAMSYAADFETPGEIASMLAERVVYGLPDDTFATYVPRVLAVDVRAMQRAAESWVRPDRLAIVVVGDRKAVEAPLRALKIAPVRVVTVDEILGPAPVIDEK